MKVDWLHTMRLFQRDNGESKVEVLVFKYMSVLGCGHKIFASARLWGATKGIQTSKILYDSAVFEFENPATTKPKNKSIELAKSSSSSLSLAAREYSTLLTMKSNTSILSQRITLSKL